MPGNQASGCLIQSVQRSFPGYSDGKESAWVGKILWRMNDYPLSILAWRIPWTEEPGRLPLQRVGHDRVTNTFTFSCI